MITYGIIQHTIILYDTVHYKPCYVTYSRICICAYTIIYVYVCTYVCMCIYIYMYTYDI